MKNSLFYSILFLSYAPFSLAQAGESFEAKFAAASNLGCDAVLKRIEGGEDGYEETTRTRGALLKVWASCWKRSMNQALDLRLTKLKQSNPAQFKFEMGLQTVFNKAAEKRCSRNCGGGTIGSISYQFCIADTMKFRAQQAQQIAEGRLSVSGEKNEFQLGKARADRKKKKDTKYFKTFVEQLCKMPKEIWQGGEVPESCESKATKELDGYEFTDDVCDLS